MLRVAVLGAGGQLGTDLFAAFAQRHDVIGFSHEDIEVRDHAHVAEVLTNLRPDVVVNTTAFHKVDECEKDPEHSFAVNCHAPSNLALVCSELAARLVHISTDYVFGGDRRTPYPADAKPGPLNVYGVSKLAGEYLVINRGTQHVVVRTSGLYGVAGASGKGGNFVETMLRLGRERGEVSVVTDQVLSPTYTPDLAATIQGLVETGASGVFHVANSGACSWFEFAQSIFQLAGMEVDVRPTTSAEFGSGVVRPAYSVLDTARLREVGLPLPRPWEDALAAYLAAREASAGRTAISS